MIRMGRIGGFFLFLCSIFICMSYVEVNRCKSEIVYGEDG